MKIKRMRWIPFNGFKAFNFFGVLIARKGTKISEQTIRHEEIHTAQMKEMWYVFFYLYYFLEWIVRGFNYRMISFEQEAYDHEWTFGYLQERESFAWRKYLWNL